MMKKMFFASVLIICSLWAQAQNLIPQAWKFSTGDNLEWAKPEFDDSSWASILTGNAWENEGYAGYDGFGWYRTRVKVPKNQRKSAEEYGGFLLDLGKVDDVDEVYLNGELVAKTGTFNLDSFKTEWNTPRKYIIPVSKIKFGEENVIAVRVFDKDGGGGMYSSVAEFRARCTTDFITLSPALPAANHVFLDEQHIAFNIKLTNDSKEKILGSLAVEIKNDFGNEVFSQKANVNIEKKGEKLQQVNVQNLSPGFYVCKATIQNEGAEKSIQFNFAVSPEKVMSLPNSKMDFRAYWDSARRELAGVDPQFKMIKQDRQVHQGKDLYLVEMRSLDSVLIRGWYEVPQAPGKYPVILQVQGYSTNQQPEWLEDYKDFACFALNIRGHGNSQDQVNPGFPGFLLYNITNKDKYIYRGAFMDCQRAIDFLFSRPEIDTTKLVVQGQSQGGAMTFATAALANDRVKAAVAMNPFLSDFENYFKVAHWPANEFTVYALNNEDFGWNGIFNTLSYIDIRNLAVWVKCPVLMGVGLMDEVCPPRINFAAYNNLTVPREYMVFPYEGHWVGNEFITYKYEWIKKQLNMK
jgi:cephalosporin-C deacetylase-like acetyl esterase